MYLILNDKLVLFGNYLIKRFDILFGFINRYNLVFFWLVAHRSREGMRRVLLLGWLVRLNHGVLLLFAQAIYALTQIFFIFINAKILVHMIC